MDDLEKWKKFGIFMYILGALGIMEIISGLLLHNYFNTLWGILAISGLIAYLLYYKTGKEKIKERIGKISKNEYLEIENMQLKYFIMPTIVYMLLITISGIIFKNYIILITGYITGIIVFGLVEKHLLNINKSLYENKS